MPTTNPKVSGYVPQNIYNRLQDFCNEKNLSISQGITAILTQYFDLGQVDQKNTTNGLPMERLELLEREFKDFKQFVEQHLQISDIHTQNCFEVVRSEPKIDHSKLNLLEPGDSLLSSLPSELPREQASSSVVQSELLKQITPITGVKLSISRFGLSKDTVAQAKRNKNAKDFNNWTKKCDPDGIPWKWVDKPSKGYVPNGELPSEPLSRLLEWIRANL